MKNYYVCKNWFVRLIIGISFLIVTIIFMLIDQMRKIPLIVYLIFLSISFIFTLIMIILVIVNRTKFLSKIFLYDDYFEIRNKTNTLHKINIIDVDKITLKKEDYVTFFVIDYHSDVAIKVVEIEYNKNIALYFKKRNIEIIQ